MRWLLFFILIFHGLIHLLGFAKAFEIREIKELSLPISRQLGLLWLVAAVLILVFALLYIFRNKYLWAVGFPALLLSQLLIILFWKDAKFGTLPNIVILGLSLLSLAAFVFNESVKRETALLLGKVNLKSERIHSEQDLQVLPEPVQKWLRNSGVIGKPYIVAGRVEQMAEMKMKPGQKGWMKAKALQFTNIGIPGFIWSVEAEMNPVLYFQGRDRFWDGKGAMLIRLNSLFPVVDEKGPKLDEGTIQRYLGEMVWFPSLALSRYIRWEAVSDSSAVAVMEYMGTKGSGTFYFNSEGDFVRFTALRFMENTADAKRHEWVLDVQAYHVFEGIKVPSAMTATWKLDGEDWTWLKLQIKDIRYNERAKQ